MSTKAIEEALELLADETAEHYDTVRAARAELEAIREAATAWTRPMDSDRSEWMAMGDLLTAIAKERPL
jgi:hypothetical protein